MNFFHILCGVCAVQTVVLPHPVDFHGQWADAFHATAVNITKHHKLRLILHQVLLAQLHSLLEADSIGAGQGGRLNEHGLANAVGSNLGEERQVVAHAVQAIAVYQPATHIHVTLLNDQQRMQTTGFQGRCHK